ncbi:glutamic-type intramembrane protease PrsW [Neobacillus sp. CF12]|uniref:glutamic-type intramembrane protease PrsW n=1 Tax=Neobacillus sp. CF12 TaxID=3055864 RepID=UPI0025A126A9|nr:glutamic-type intramembrane protease PrsW [Neobacillus sp. CF12]MDM5331549.1 glutamic-type intramembrane protease PrsW [Neobacillus sp. CF12]
MLGILLAGVAPGLALLSYFYLKDKYEPEPVSMVVNTFFSGALIIIPIAFIEYVLKIENIVQFNSIYAIFSSGLIEEFFKWTVLFFIAYKSAEFDEPFDGIVYGTSISLGFATAENILYLMNNGMEYALTRALLPVSGHALFGVIMGYYISKAKFTKGQKWPFFLLSILLPVVLHGIFNFLLLHQGSWFAMSPYMVFLWWFSLRKVQLAEVSSYQHFKKNAMIPTGLSLKSGKKLFLPISR